jgi:hypothetical protein
LSKLAWLWIVCCWLFGIILDELFMVFVMLYLKVDDLSYTEFNLKLPCEYGLSWLLFKMLILMWGVGIILVLFKETIYTFCWFTTCGGVCSCILVVLLLLMILKLFVWSLPYVASLFFL